MPDMTQRAVFTYDIDRERRDIDVSKDIARLLPDETPFAAILMRAKKENTNTAEYVWFDEEPGGWWAKAEATLVDATDIVVDDASLFAQHDIIKVPRTGEVMYVTASDLDTDTITVVRGYGTTAAAALEADDWIMRMGNAMHEGSNAPDVKVKQPKKFVNFTQIFRTPFDQTGTSAAESLKTNEKERVRLRKNKAIEHRLDIERAALFGEKKEDVANKRRMTGGVLSFIESNVMDISSGGGALSESDFETYCEMLFQYGSKKKLLICSPRVGSVINQFATGKIQTRSGEDTYGIALSEYLSFHGRLYIVTSKTFEKEYAGMALGVDMENIQYRPLNGRDTSLKTNIQAEDYDGWKDEYFTEAGMQVRLEQTHAVLKGVTSAA